MLTIDYFGNLLTSIRSWGGLCFFLGSALLVAARTAKVGWHLKRKI